MNTLQQHREAFTVSWQRLCKNLRANLLTVLVMTISLSLPTLFFVLEDNVAALSQHWDSGNQITLYLQQHSPRFRVDDLLQRLRHHKLVNKARYISPEQGLKEFSQQSDMKSVLDVLDKNPLPPAIVVSLNDRIDDDTNISKLIEELTLTPIVSTAQLDKQWLHRLNSFLQLSRHSTLLLAILLGIGVLLTTSNSVRMSAAQHRNEISIYQHVGATNSYIRRPFLYTGVMFGVVAGLLTWSVITLFILCLTPAVANVAALYGSNFKLHSLGLLGGGLLVVISAVLALLGATIATRHP